MRKILQDERGFTLIEMVLVVLIIAALLLIFIPNIGKTRQNAVEKSEAAVVKVVETQMQNYMLETGKNSVSPEELVPEYINEEQLQIYNKSKSN